MSRLKIAIVPMLLTKDRSFYQASYQRFMVPLGPIALASYVESLNLPVDILVHDQIETVLHFKPDVVGISSVSENFGHAQNIAKLLKETIRPFVIIGGPHFTSMPDFLPDCFDAGVVGEGELVLGNILSKFLEKGVSKEHLKGIPGLVLKYDGQLTPPTRAPQIEKLDVLPMPHRKPWVRHLGLPHIMTTRGCVYSCFFCAEPTLFKGYRQFSPERIVEEIENILTDYPATTHVRFYDDIFPVNLRRLRELCDLMEKRKIPERASFSCFIHAKLVNEEVVSLLKRMNFIFVQFGAETGSPKLLKQIKPASSVELNQKAINLFHRHGIQIGLTFIVGTPEETPEDLKKTYQFIKKNRDKLIDVEISPAVALPGTSLWETAVKRNLIPKPEEMNWEVFRDSANLKEFDLDRYIYLADQVPPDFFLSMLHKFSKLVEEIQRLNGTEKFLRENYLAGYIPVSFRSPRFDEEKTGHNRTKAN
ncbi:MAG: radical SAM protein [bacterium]